MNKVSGVIPLRKRKIVLERDEEDIVVNDNIIESKRMDRRSYVNQLKSERHELGSSHKIETFRRGLDRFKNGSLFSHAYSYPNGIELDGQETKEKIILIFRSHQITILPKLLTSVLLILAAFLVYPFLSFATVKASGVIFAFSLLCILVAITNAIFAVISWFYHLNIITTERIVDVDFLGINSYRVSEARIEKIEDVSISNEGVWGAMFNYGCIRIQTAGTQNLFEFTHVRDPGVIQDILRDLMELKEQGVEVD